MTRLMLNVFKDDMNPDGLLYRMILAPNWLHYEVIIFLIIIAAIILISFVTPKADYAAIKGLTIGSALKEQIAEVRASYNYWDVINSAIIIALRSCFTIISGNTMNLQIPLRCLKN
ncbi:MAG: hypothetical protein U5K79_09025 [Cyclobacteriaceae bacterium]|nr:hypothetical protein [Cyclobacteriaceae bacterium]